MQMYIQTQAAKLYGSGWAWHAYNTKTYSLEYVQTEIHNQLTELNQDLVPLLAIDVWEHAFYYDYENRKPEYLANIWMLVDWDVVQSRLVAVWKADPSDTLTGAK